MDVQSPPGHFLGLFIRVAGLLFLTGLLGGCQSMLADPPPDPSVGIACWAMQVKNPMLGQYVDYITVNSDRGDLVCKLVLGGMYERGDGVHQNIPKARALYQAVAEVDARGSLELARMAEQGIGQPVDYVSARRLYRQADSEAVRTDSQVALARLMEEGKGGPKDLQGALALDLAAAHDSKDKASQAIQRLRAAGLVLSAAQQDRVNAVWAKSIRDRATLRVDQQYRALRRLVQASPASTQVTVRLIYTVGSRDAQVSLSKSCGDSAIDSAVLAAIGKFEFPGDPIMPAGLTTLTVDMPFNFERLAKR